MNPQNPKDPNEFKHEVDVDDMTAMELDRILNGEVAFGDTPTDWEWVASLVTAEVALAHAEPMPAKVRERLLTTVLAQVADPQVGTKAKMPWFAYAGWIVACGLIVSIAVPYFSSNVKSVAQARAELLRQGGKVVQVAWNASEHPDGKGAKGDVVWDPSSQKGFMRFQGLRANDPKQAQYQLWVFDASRDERYPVDGGVFDIPSNQQEVIIPIQVKLPVKQAVLFAVTREKPGGVVVSDRSQLVIAAKP